MHLGNIRKKSLSWNISLHFWKILFSKGVDVKAVFRENISSILLKENKPMRRTFKVKAPAIIQQHAACNMKSNDTNRSKQMNLMKMVTFSASAEVMMASFSAGPLPEVVRLTVFTALCQACTWEAWGDMITTLGLIQFRENRETVSVLPYLYYSQTLPREERSRVNININYNEAEGQQRPIRGPVMTNQRVMRCGLSKREWNSNYPESNKEKL